MEFITHCPPDVPPKSRILGLCGITDWQNLASPQEDGWFFSDFYLFHHLLSPMDVPSSNQCWLTCEKPEDVVAKYTKYSHGDPKKERRIVLEKDTLPRITQAGNLRVVPREDLLERLLPKDASVTLLMTSCFSGGWLVQPDITDSREELLNATGVTAAGPTEETRSWPLSRSVGHASGSIVATATLQSLIDIEEAAPEEQEKQQIHFAQDDEWETEYRHRLGLPLASYKDRWESLRKIPATGGQGSGEGTTSMTGHLRKRRQVRILARRYFASYPGLDEWAANLSLHQRLKKILGNTDDFDAKEIDRLYNCITYRLGAMHEADEVRRNMGIQFPSIFGFDVDKWKLDESARVLEQPVGGGLYYTKPWYYLGIALTESGMDWNEIQSKVAMAASGR
ncbi:hypothetical protein M432DRAFT_631996 [Thermoascus aurantiacus ATCC 26904]